MSLTSLRRRHKTFLILQNLIRGKIEKFIPVVLEQRCGERIGKNCTNFLLVDLGYF